MKEKKMSLKKPELINIEIFTQSYEKKAWIDGVQIISLNRFRDDGGSFSEILRINEPGGNNPLNNFNLCQINHSYVSPGVIKAWHIHFNQEDLWYVPPKDRLLVGLYDLRKDSPTVTQEMRFVLGEGDGRLLCIPRGVAHGCANLYERDMQLIYFVNKHFSASDPDEHRLPYDEFVGKEFWEIQKG
jgi:dTDP-4-dehydrorhamnose 3,5-epimerase